MGYTDRKLKRKNTFHLRAKCPNCGKDNMHFYKDLVFTLKSKQNEHDKWYCKKCHSTFKREELKNVYFV